MVAIFRWYFNALINFITKYNHSWYRKKNMCLGKVLRALMRSGFFCSSFHWVSSRGLCSSAINAPMIVIGIIIIARNVFFDHSVVYFKILEELMEFTFPPVSLAPHMSWADMVLLSVLPPEFSVVAKAGVKEYPFFGSMSSDLILCRAMINQDSRSFQRSLHQSFTMLALLIPFLHSQVRGHK